MSSIRPFVTITILVAVGVFLFTKINEGPAPLPPEVESMLDTAPGVEVPPLAGDLASTGLPAAPSWNDPPAATGSATVAAPAMPPTTLTAEVPTTMQSTAPAELPPIPELPPVATNDATSMPIAPTAQPKTPVDSPIPLPANIPIAQYPGAAAAPAPTVEAMTPPAPITTQPLAQPTDNMSLPPIAEAAMPAAPPTPMPTPTDEDRYGAIPAIEAPVAAAPMTPPAAIAAPTFASVVPEIQGALERQELVAAHAMLSRWYGNPTLTPAEAQQVETLLSQLAGTIVYSTEHRLEPPYTVQQGDTLQSIAQQYEVPWQLLAKINGIADPNAVQVGQQLKVIHGPFAAIVELDKSQLTLMLDGRYAGRFPAKVEPGATVSEGQWVLDQKLVQPTTQNSTVVSASYTSAVEHVLVLRSDSPAAAGATIAITGGPSTPSGPKVEVPKIQLSPRDVEEVADILSVGSTVTIRR